jgi:hypothetical protein
MKRAWLPFYSSLVIYLLALTLRWSKRSVPWGVLLIIGLGLLYYGQAWNRNDHIHRVPTLLAASIVLVTIIARKDQLHGPLRLALTCVLCMASFVYVYHPLFRWKTNVIGATEPNCNAGKARYLRCGNVNLAEAAQFINANVPASDTIFVGNVQHRHICGYDLMFYFLADRLSGTKFANLLSGVTNTLEVQQQIVGDLERNQVRWVVLFAGTQNCLESNGSQTDSGVRVLDDFIRDQFQFVQRYGPYEIRTRSVPLSSSVPQFLGIPPGPLRGMARRNRTSTQIRENAGIDHAR